MYRYLITLALCAAAGGAIAADMPVKTPVAPLAAAQLPYSGIYFGAVGAVAKTPTDVVFLDIPGSGNIRPSGAMAGGLIGAGVWRNGFFLGIEGDFSFDFSKAKQPCSFVSECEVKSGWFLTQRLVIGAQLADITGAARRAAPASVTQWRDSLNVPSTLSSSTLMPYITAGLAERRTEACVHSQVAVEEGAPVAVGACAKQWLIGPTVGGGLRIPVASGWSIGAEYLFVKYNKHFTPDGGPPIFATQFETISEHVVRASLLGHF